uniref:lebercilin n=1 Tax=Myxine glutinosa TaxID=7769 RepID=UPI0035901B8A
MASSSSPQGSPTLTWSEITQQKTSATSSIHPDEKSDSDDGKKGSLQHHFSRAKQRRTKRWNTPGSKTIQNIYGVPPRSACTEKGIRLPKLASNELPSHETSSRAAPGLPMPMPMHTFQFQMVTDLRNEAKELRRKLNDALRENCMVRRLQIRQEHSLARYESQEAEFPRLVASHIADIQVVHEAVRRAREAERISTKRATRCEAELYRNQKALQHLQELAERRDLKERGQLSQKLEQVEKQLEELKLDKQVLLRNLQLNKNSFQRQLLDAKRLTTKLQNSAALLQTEVQQLTRKLEDKERDLVTLSMHSAKLFKSSSRKKEARQLKECVAGSGRSPGDSVSHIGSQQKGKVPPKKKRSDAYFDPIDCSEPRRKENQNGEEEELTTEAKGETAEEPDVMKDTESWRENERQATSDSTTALNSVLERAESSAMEMSWFKLRSPQQATLMQSPEASGDLMRDDQWHKELLLAKLRALDEGKDVERNSPSPTLKDIARPSLVMQNSNKDRFERMMMMKDGPLIFSPPQTSHLKKEVVGEMNVQGMPEQEFGEH